MTRSTTAKAVAIAGATLLAGLGSGAAAQNFTQDFEGFYAGLHLDMSVFNTDNADLNNQFNSNAPEQSQFLGNGGLTFGYNRLLSGGVIIGGEVDFTSAMEISEFVSSNVAETTGTQVDNALDSVIAIKARAGVQSDNVLMFVSGGFASGAGNFETYQVDTGGGLISCDTSTCASVQEDVYGVAIGAGVEYAFRENWIGRFEVQHMSFDDVAAPVVDSAGDPACASGETDLCSVIYTPSATAVRLGIFYKF